MYLQSLFLALLATQAAAQIVTSTRYRNATATTLQNSTIATTSGPSTVQIAVASSTISSGPVTTPSPIQDGMVSNCQKFYLVQDGDSCAAIVDEAQDSYFFFDDFLSWNPAVGSSCEGLVPDYYVCIGVPGTPTGPPPGPQPQQPGITQECNNYYLVQEGDSCETIVDQYGTFSLDLLYSWNPALNSDCSGLYYDYYICVGVPGTPTTRPPPTSTRYPQPQQTGITEDCQKWYIVKSGDSCQGIVDQFRTFTLQQFYAWNPAIGSDCKSLIIDYNVCVGVTGTPDKPVGTPPPGPVQSGIAANCNSYYRAVKDDTCEVIRRKNNNRFSLQQFYGWNPAVGGERCNGVWVDYYYCTGVEG